MADFAPQRASHPRRSVVTVAELLRNRHEGGTPTGRPTTRTAVSVGALIRREGGISDLVEHTVEPRSDRISAELTVPRRRLASTAGTLLAIGSMAGAAIMLGNTVVGPANTGAVDGGYPGKGVLDDTRPLPRGGLNVARPGDDGLALGFAPVSSVRATTLDALLADRDLSASGLGGGALPGGTAGIFPGAVPGNGASGGGGAQSVGGVLGGGGGAVGGTVSNLGGSLGPVGAPVRSLGSTVSRTTPSLGGTVDSTVGGVGSAAAGSALSSLTKPITGGDAVGGTAGSLLGGASSAKSSGRHASDGRKNTRSKVSSSGSGKHFRVSDRSSDSDDDSGRSKRSGDSGKSGGVLKSVTGSLGN